MKECRNCKVEILDNTAVCPLCSSVLEISGSVQEWDAYPDVKAVVRKLSFIVRLYSFLAIVSETALVAVNYLYFLSLIHISEPTRPY